VIFYLSSETRRLPSDGYGVSVSGVSHIKSRNGHGSLHFCHKERTRLRQGYGGQEEHKELVVS
jgi:hypothetical protein